MLLANSLSVTSRRSHQYLEVKGATTEFIPLGMDIEIINGVAELKFAVTAAIKRRQLIFFGGIEVPPIVIWFYVLQKNTALLCADTNLFSPVELKKINTAQKTLTPIFL
jgi:hypothetical protein